MELNGSERVPIIGASNDDEVDKALAKKGVICGSCFRPAIKTMTEIVMLKVALTEERGPMPITGAGFVCDREDCEGRRRLTASPPDDMVAYRDQPAFTLVTEDPDGA